METPAYSLADLLRIMQRLRDPQHGCPWDLKQDFASIVPSTLEECYELAAAIEAGDYGHLADELGDVLFQVVFYAQLGAERELFTFDEVVNGLARKLLRRHPHVFAGGKIEGLVDARSDSETVKLQWEDIKAQERGERQQDGVLDDVPTALPALPRAQKLQKRAARVGFDWPDAPSVLAKLDEEMAELSDAVRADDQDGIEEELGDLLFTVVNVARHLKVDAESALRHASQKFERRFRRMETVLAGQKRAMQELDMQQMELLWEDAKTSS